MYTPSIFYSICVSQTKYFSPHFLDRLKNNGDTVEESLLERAVGGGGCCLA
jgi:hypothetical protein